MQSQNFRVNLGGVESVLFVLVPTFAIHDLTSKILKSLLYNRPGIRPVQQINILDSQENESLIHTLDSISTGYKKFLGFKEVQIKSVIEHEGSKIADTYRAIILSPNSSEKNIYEAFKSHTFSKSDDLSWIKIYHTDVNYSYWNVPLSTSMKNLFRSVESELKNHQSEYRKDLSDFFWTDFYVHSFEQVGHIAHINLPEAFSILSSSTLKDAKFVLGSMILDHHPHISLVISKAKSIDSEFREMSIEVLAIRPPIASIDDNARDFFHISASKKRIDEKGIALVFRNSEKKKGPINKPYYSQNLPANSPLYTVRRIKHNECNFTFSFYHCFFNKRLEEEHRQIKNIILFSDECVDVVFDVFAGVGPISVPIAARRASQCTRRLRKNKLSFKVSVVHANDLNPMCYKYLQENAQENETSLPTDKTYKPTPKVAKLVSYDSKTSLSQAPIYMDLIENGGDPLLYAWNMDGLTFICESLNLWKSKNVPTGENKRFCHFIMNLPGSAAEDFLTPFGQIMYASDEKEGMWTPARGDGVIVHVYTFAAKCDSKLNMLALRKVHNGLHKSFEKEYITLETLEKEFCVSAPETIRNIAPRKEMVRVSFALTRITAHAYRLSRSS